MTDLTPCRIIPADNAVIQLFDGFLDLWEAHRMFARLHKFTPWRQDQITIYGRKMEIPRLQAWYGDPQCTYSYSGISLDPHPWTPLLMDLKRRIELVADTDFNSVLMNLYRDGRDSNGWHADNEPELGPEPVIASLSLGGERRFRLRNNADKKQVISIDLSSGSLLLMAGKTQQCWKHCITKTTRQVEPRINLTFRKILPITP